MTAKLQLRTPRWTFCVFDHQGSLAQHNPATLLIMASATSKSQMAATSESPKPKASVQAIATLDAPASKAVAAVRPALLLALLAFRFRALVKDPVSELQIGLPIVAAIQVAYTVVCLPAAGSQQAKPAKKARPGERKKQESTGPNLVVVWFSSLARATPDQIEPEFPMLISYFRRRFCHSFSQPLPPEASTLPLSSSAPLFSTTSYIHSFARPTSPSSPFFPSSTQEASMAKPFSLSLAHTPRSTRPSVGCSAQCSARGSGLCRFR